MFHAFAVIKKADDKARGINFELNSSHPLAVEIDDVLRARDKAMPIWRRVVEAQRKSIPPVIRGSRGGRESNGAGSGDPSKRTKRFLAQYDGCIPRARPDV